MRAPLVPEDFVVPEKLETPHFRFRMLSVSDVEKDYEAVMETQRYFHNLGSKWPRDGFTLEENLADLQRHQDEFLTRKAFAYTVVALDESRVLGCLYIEPSDEAAVDAEVWLWIRSSQQAELDQILFDTIKEWLDAEWPFETVHFPYREHPPYVGGCLCGAVRYVAKAPPFAAEYCHCRMCQKGVGSVVVSWMDFKVDQVSWRFDPPTEYLSSETGRRGFCPTCGSTISYRDTRYPDYLTLTIASLDNPNLVTPTYHIYTDSQPDWFKIDDHHPRYPQSRGS